jgi:glycerol-3-phosphate dehydrogenase
MKRNLKELSNNIFDLLIIGGGIGGVSACWDATLRGLSTALIEKGDFGEATSSASSKILHGGIRYLQKVNFLMLRESLRNRRTFMQIAPHLVYSLPFLIPTYGHAMKGKEILSLAMVLYDLIGFDRNKELDPSLSISGFKRLSKNRILELEPRIPSAHLTGGILYHECHMYNSERMTLSFALSAAKIGAIIANYIEAVDFLMEEDQVVGIKAKDNLSGETFDIRAKLILNITGPWAFKVLNLLPNYQQKHIMRFAKGIHVVTRKLINDYALALTSRQQRVSLLDRGGRHIFFIPWRGHTLIGTANVPYDALPDSLKITRQDICDFLEEINHALPYAELNFEDIYYAFAGLYPLVDISIEKGVYQYSAKNKIFDHKKKDGIEGLLSVIGAKYTTAISLSKRVIDLCFKKLAKKPSNCLTDVTPLIGGEIHRLKDITNQAYKIKPPIIKSDTLQNILRNYGSAYDVILKYIETNPELGKKVSDIRPTIRAEIVHAVREEMAQKLSDVVFRRTGLGTLGNPGVGCISLCADIMAEELGWDKDKTQSEISEVASQFIIQD